MAQSGVGAVLIKKHQKPVWKPASLSEVSDEHIASHYFSPLDPAEELPL